MVFQSLPSLFLLARHFILYCVPSIFLGSWQACRALILSIEWNTKNICCAGFSTQNWAVPFFEYFLLISLYLLISTATEHLYKSGIQDRQNKVWESDSNMLTLLTLSTTFVGPTLEKSYQAASHFCSGMALMLGPNFVGFDLKARRLYPTNMGFNPLDSIPRGIHKSGWERCRNYWVHGSQMAVAFRHDLHTPGHRHWTEILWCFACTCVRITKNVELSAPACVFLQFFPWSGHNHYILRFSFSGRKLL